MNLFLKETHSWVFMLSRHLYYVNSMLKYFAFQSTEFTAKYIVLILLIIPGHLFFLLFEPKLPNFYGKSPLTFKIT